jgi:hypothetical protein
MIDQLSLTNFKAFRSADIRLAAVTLLTRLNSSGKSTVLQSLAHRYAWSARYAPEQEVLPLADVVLPSDLPELWARTPLFSRRFHCLKADRIVPAPSCPRSHHQAIGRGFLGSRGEHIVNFLRHHAPGHRAGRTAAPRMRPGRPCSTSSETFMCASSPVTGVSASG